MNNITIKGHSLKLKFYDADGCLTKKEGVARLRKLLNISTKEFGLKLGVSGRTVEGWEQGRTVRPRMMRLIKDRFL